MAKAAEWDGTTMPEGDATADAAAKAAADAAAKAATGEMAALTTDQINAMIAAGMTPEQIAEMMGGAEMDEWAENMEDGAGWAKLWALHTMICDRILQTHTEVSKWNDADEAGKKDMEDQLGEELGDWLRDWVDGAVGSFAVASTALAAGVAVLAF